jgi:hypothetical protein
LTALGLIIMNDVQFVHVYVVVLAGYCPLYELQSMSIYKLVW